MAPKLNNQYLRHGVIFEYLRKHLKKGLQSNNWSWYLPFLLKIFW